MQYNFRIALTAAVIVPAAVFGAFSMPPLTSSGGGALPGVTEAEYKQAINQEFAHCRESGSDANCECYAHRSGIIQTNKEIQVIGLIYADKQKLARDQAEQAC